MTDKLYKESWDIEEVFGNMKKPNQGKPSEARRNVMA